MKLLILQYSIAPYRYDFFNALAEGADTSCCLFSRMVAGREIVEDEYLSNFNFEVSFLPDVRKMSFRQAWRTVSAAIRTAGPDVIVTQECNMISAMAVFYRFWYQKDYRVYSLIDDSYDMLVLGQSWSPWHPLAEKLLIPCYDDVIVLDPRVRDVFSEKYGKGFYFPIMRREEIFRKGLEEALPVARDWQERYALEDVHVFLYVGRLTEVKNLYHLISSFLLLNPSDAVLVLVGDGELESSLRSAAGGDDRVIFTGHRTGYDLLAWFNLADTFILPSYMECYGAVVNEALLAGCWCLVSSSAGSSTLIRNGENGEVFSPNYQEDLVSAMKKALSRPKRDRSVVGENRMCVSFLERMESLKDKIAKDHEIQDYSYPGR